MAALFQLGPQFGVIVEFPVVDENVAAAVAVVARRKGLRSPCMVEDGQTPMPQRHAVGFMPPDAAAVGAAMLYTFQHGRNGFRPLPPDARNAAHREENSCCLLLEGRRPPTAGSARP